jgi:small subunit ribosomal protein S6
MRRYETIIIVDPDLSAEERAPVLQRVADVVNQGEGYLAPADEWGARKLAYEIKKKDRGYYIRFDFCGAGAVVDEMERFFRIDDRVMKYMTVLLDKTADIEKIKEEIAEAQSKAAADKEQAETAEARTQEEPAESGAAQPAAAQTESAEIQSREEPAEADEAQTPGLEVGGNEASPTEAEEEKK